MDPSDITPTRTIREGFRWFPATIMRVIHLEFCGSGPGKDSPMQDWANGKPEQLDGAYAIGRGCGGRLDPCVIFPGG